MKFKDYRDDKYKFPKIYLYPKKTDKPYSYFPSTAGTKCCHRKISRKERKIYVKMALETYRKSDLEIRRKYYYGWN